MLALAFVTTLAGIQNVCWFVCLFVGSYKTPEVKLIGD